MSQTSSPPSSRKRFAFLMFGCFAWAGMLLARAAWIQIGADQRIENLSRRQFGTRFLISPRRGAILDRNGEPIAINSETRSLAVNPEKIIHKRIVARLLAKSLGLSEQKLLTHLTQKKSFAWIKRHLTDTEFEKLRMHRVIGRDGDLLSGLWIVNESERVYPHNELAAHLIGGTNLDSEGTEGVELWQNEKLRGKVISVSAVKDALGRPAFIDSSAEKAAQDGKDGEAISLTIDASLQFAVEEELRKAVQKAGARGGSVIVMNAIDGEILAMANEPSFNPNFRGASPDRKRNRAVTDGYEPGSTLKPALLATALMNGMKLTDQIYGEHGKFKIGGRTISEAEAHERFEWLSLKKIIQVSSNVGAAKLALKMGADRYLAALKNFGFGNKTGVGFPGEISGRVPPRKSWTPITLANIGFGHGVLVTPLQMIRLYASFLNGGWLVQPTIVKTQGPKPEPQRIMPEKVTAQVLEALESTTQTKEGGTGGNANLYGYRVAGKTGTAQKVDPITHKYSRSKYVASFIGFPLAVEPRIVIFASIDEPHGQYYGGAIAAPLFREVLNAAANRFSLPTKGDAKLATVAIKSKIAAPASVSDVLKTAQAAAHLDHPAVAPSISAQDESASGGDWKMPSLKGLTAREVVESLQGHSLQLEMQGTGLVQSQSPEAGQPVSEGQTVRLNLGGEE